MIGFSVYIILITGYGVLQYYKKVPKFSLSISNSMLFKLAFALGQLLGLFAQQTSIFSEWFEDLTSVLLRYSMPFEVNPACLAITNQLKSRNLGFLVGWINFLIFGLCISVLLTVHRIDWIRRKSKPSRFMTIQHFAAILCVSAAVPLLSSFIDFDEIGASIGAFHARNFFAVLKLQSFQNMVANLISALVMLADFYFLIGYACRMYRAEVKKESSRSRESGTESEDEKAWRQVDRLVPFFAGFANQVREQADAAIWKFESTHPFANSSPSAVHPRVQ